MDYLTEAAVLQRYDMFNAAELRRARKKGLLAFFDFKSGIRYTVADLESYIVRTYRRGPDLLAAPTASPVEVRPVEAARVLLPEPKAERRGKAAALTPELETATAEAVAAAILGRRGKPR
ncbi:MAG: hypothetical protein KF904_14335 [Rhodoblastus sp.]|nr:hypothetical protein [Rhodoblastus sp.]